MELCMYLTCIRKSMTFDATKWHTKMCNSSYIQNLVLGMDLSACLQNKFFLRKESFFVVFFHEWNEQKNPQLNISSQNFSMKHNFLKWNGRTTKIWHPLFHRIWKKTYPALGPSTKNYHMPICPIQHFFS